MKTKLFFIITITLLAGSLKAENVPVRSSGAAGYAIDLLPSIISSMEKKPGYSFQAWAGSGNIKLRLVSAHLYQPDSLLDNSFTKYEMNVTAFIFDYFFKDNFSGLWIGSGTEIWNCSIENKASGTAVQWSDNILTLGAGYVWKITENIYLDPFAAVHYRMNDGKVFSSGEEFERKRISASASVKIGYMFNL